MKCGVFTDSRPRVTGRFPARLPVNSLPFREKSIRSHNSWTQICALEVTHQGIGNLRTTTKFTTTTSVDWERTGTTTSVSAGKRKLKMQSTGRSTTTTLNVNKHVDCDVRSQQSFFAKASFKTMQDLIL